jgi:hypothetical protein
MKEYCDKCNPGCTLAKDPAPSCYRDFYASIILEQDLKIVKLEKQIERMKNCDNCKGCPEGCAFTVCSKWQLRWEIK